MRPRSGARLEQAYANVLSHRERHGMGAGNQWRNVSIQNFEAVLPELVRGAGRLASIECSVVIEIEIHTRAEKLRFAKPPRAISVEVLEQSSENPLSAQFEFEQVDGAIVGQFTSASVISLGSHREIDHSIAIEIAQVRHRHAERIAVHQRQLRCRLVCQSCHARLGCPIRIQQQDVHFPRAGSHNAVTGRSHRQIGQSVPVQVPQRGQRASKPVAGDE